MDSLTASRVTISVVIFLYSCYHAWLGFGSLYAYSSPTLAISMMVAYLLFSLASIVFFGGVKIPLWLGPAKPQFHCCYAFRIFPNPCCFGSCQLCNMVCSGSCDTYGNYSFSGTCDRWLVGLFRNRVANCNVCGLWGLVECRSGGSAFNGVRWTRIWLRH